MKRVDRDHMGESPHMLHTCTRAHLLVQIIQPYSEVLPSPCDWRTGPLCWSWWAERCGPPRLNGLKTKTWFYCS